MSASNTGPGGVRNLRAMFENKANDQSTSPPSRGRSPNGSVSSQQERPLSKVRASFVAVEKPGEDGQAQPSSRKPSDVTMDGTSETNVAENQGLGEILKGSPFMDDGKFPDTGPQPSEPNGVADRAAAMVKKMQAGNTNPPPTIGLDELEGTPTRMPRGHGPTKHGPRSPVKSTGSPTDTVKPSNTPRGPVVKPKGGVGKIQGVMESAASAQEEREATQSSSGPIVKPKGGVAKIQGVMESAAKAQEERDAANAIKVPIVKPKGGVGKIQGVMESAARAQEERDAAGAAKGPIVKPKGGVGKIQGVMESAAQAQKERDAADATKGPIVKPKGGVGKIQGVMESAAQAQEGREATAEAEAKAEAAAADDDEETKGNEEASDPQDNTYSADKPKNGSSAQASGLRLKGGVQKIQGVMESAARAREARAAAAAESAAKDKPPAASRLPRSSLPARKAPSATTSAPTSSAARTDDTKPTDPKPAEKKNVRAPIRMAQANSPATVSKKPSRTSLATSEASKPKSAARPADEGFLARMTRPTASSAQKAHEKVQASSPPRQRQASGKTLSARPSRRSLSQAADDTVVEPDTDIPAVPALPAEEDRDKVESA